MIPRWLPTMRTSSEAGSKVTTETTAERWKSSTSCLRRRCHADTASITSEPVTSEARRTWAYPQRNTGLVISALIEDSSGRPVVGFVV